MRRVGVLGGTFDPPHLGHLVVADRVGEQLGLDEVRLAVANHPWQKHGSRSITSADRRLAMVSEAVRWASGTGIKGEAGRTAITVSDIELRIDGPSYTSVTLDHLVADEPNTEWVVIVGSDAAAGLDSWFDADRLARQAVFAVVDRPGPAAGARPPDGFEWIAVEVPALEISSSELRRRVADGRSVRFLTPRPVIDLVNEWGLYRPERDTARHLPG